METGKNGNIEPLVYGNFTPNPFDGNNPDAMGISGSTPNQLGRTLSDAKAMLEQTTPPASQADVLAIPGLGRITNDEEGFLTLQFKDEDAAQAFMQRYECTVDVDQMPPSRDTISTAPLAALSDDQLDELHERLEEKVKAAVRADPACTGGVKVERRMYLRALLADLRQAL
jgi:hypothetical protein